MKIFIKDQTNELARHLEVLKRVPVTSYDISTLKEKSSSILIGSTANGIKLDQSLLSNYAIFPTSIMTSLAEWIVAHREMRVGDTIVQQVYLPPTPQFSQKVVFGVRISEIIDEPKRKGFRYETLEGHVEKGISTFVMQETERGVEFKIHTHSTPGNVITKLLGPFFSVPYQAYCTRRALEYVKGRIERTVGSDGAD